MRHPRPRMRRAVAAAVAVLAVGALTAGCTALPEPDAQQPTSTAPTGAARQQESPDPTTDPTLAPIEAPVPTASPAEPEPKVSVELIETTPPADSEGGGKGGGSGSGGGTAQGSQGSTAASVTEASTTYAQRLVALANEARAEAGLPALEVSSCARSAAKARAGRALAKAQLEHEPLNFSCDRSWAGENLARHYGNPQAMHRAWMDSPGHRENILRPEFTRVGVGCVAYSSKDRQQPAARSADVGGQVCAQVFLG